jgi:protein gp37
MAQSSMIEWTDATWNPVTGCSKVSPGCAHCYAEALTERFAGRPGYIEEHRPWTPENAEHNVRLHPERLGQPLSWRKPRMVFVNSMSDLFHELVPMEFLGRIFNVMGNAPQHVFQVLTKRPEVALERLRAYYETLGLAPLPNVWLGVSIENARYTWRADVLREIPAAVRFISAEPLLGSLLADEGRRYPLTLSPKRPLNLADIDWLIVGGESGGRDSRPMHPEWVRELLDACHGVREGEDSGTAFFFKQWGSHDQRGRYAGAGPKSGGRELDGRTWDEMPTIGGTHGQATLIAP